VVTIGNDCCVSSLTPRGNRTRDVRTTAASLLPAATTHATLHELAVDPATVLRQRYGIEVVLRPPAAPGKCSIDGSYRRNPLRISVSSALSTRRVLFSILHEFGHHLQRRSFEAIDARTRAGKKAVAFEEDVCDAFAADILVPDTLVDEILDGHDVTAAALVRLFHESQASREACCVRIVQRLRTDGYVILADADGVIRFAASNHDYRIRRDTEQGSTHPLAAAATRQVREKARFRYPSGWQTPVYFLDALADQGWVLAVAQQHPPSWAVIPLRGNELFPLPPDEDCAHCGESLTVWQEPCTDCRKTPCPSCGRCSCRATSIKSQLCSECFLMKALLQFPHGSGICYDCST
jgi:Zn-dependent peptidase ImmA (M78 family)